MAFLVIILFWAILFALSWPIALILLLFIPFLWLLSIPFRIAGIVLEGVFALIRQIVLLPARLFGYR